ncbi:MAG: ankyrin repeat domain-containing protein [Thermodesulfobacteriota bacterium]|nr:ankyrin repeat domain-containing protein [Thermodesulfobacteriota bacterium]
MAALTGCGSALIRAAHQGDVAAMEKLLDQGADINEFSLGSDPPLHMAAKRGDLRMVSFLLDRGADIDIKTFGGLTGGPTPLMQSSKNGHVAVSELLPEFCTGILKK